MKKKLILICAILFLFSCKKQSVTDSSGIAKQRSTNQLRVEEAFPGQTGEIKSGKYYGRTLNYMAINGYKVFEGDILLTLNAQSSLVTNSTGRSNSLYRWPGGTVYYALDPGLSPALVSLVNSAITYWQTTTANTTNINFVQRTNQTNYVTFIDSSIGPASSGVGCIGGQQYIYINSNCSTGNVIHEIGHAAGFWHEQSRSDRDTYITINFNNIISGYQTQFQTYIQQGNDGFDLAGGLDLGSVMMYPSDAFSFNGLPTITKKDGSTFTAQRNGLSSADVNGVKFMYPLPVSINGSRYYAWTHSGSGSGTINAAPGSVVQLTIAAFGPGNSVNFTLTGATLTPTGSPVVVNNNDVSRTFTMPASGSVTWSATYVTPTGGGNGNIGVGIVSAPLPPTVNINGASSYKWTQNTSTSGTIHAPANTLVHMSFNAEGPGMSINFTLSGVQFTGTTTSNIVVSNNFATRTFTMPTGGSVNWTGTFTQGQGSGEVDVN